MTLQTHSTPLVRRSGFTLIELLVVIGIMALVAGMVVAVYDTVQSKAEQSVARQQLATVREALLRFRVDMGYFPGEGPLAPASLNLDQFHYVDGAEPANPTPGVAAKARWATHPLNLWMLFEKPVAIKPQGPEATPVVIPGHWDWKPSVGRGWQGPYLGLGMGAKLDAAGAPDWGFLGGEHLSNRLYAVTDLIGASPGAAAALRWVMEDVALSDPKAPVKTPMAMGGRPIAFLRDDMSTPGWVIYRLVSAGADGIFQTRTVPLGDDIVIEVSRHRP